MKGGSGCEKEEGGRGKRGNGSIRESKMIDVGKANEAGNKDKTTSPSTSLDSCIRSTT